MDNGIVLKKLTIEDYEKKLLVSGRKLGFLLSLKVGIVKKRLKGRWKRIRNFFSELLWMMNLLEL